MITETISLANYAWTRNRTATIAVLGVALFGEVVALSLWLTSKTNEISAIGPGLLLLSLFPCWLYSLALFDFGNRANLLSKEGGYDRWLLQLPLPTWKLALIPTALLTVWMLCSWAVFALTIRLIGGPMLLLVPQALAMGAAAILVTSLAWKPQRWPWQRLATFIVLFPVLYGVMTISLIVEFEAPQWRWAVWIGVVLCYTAANAHAVRSVALARISAFQQRSSRGFALPSMRTAKSGSPIRFDSAAAALHWHDLSRSQNARAWLVAGFLLTLAPLLVLLLPFAAATAVFGLVMIAVVAQAASMALIESPVSRGQSSLPGFLIASPLPSFSIARSRLASVARMHGKYFVLLSLLLPLCMVWESNRVALASWFTSPHWSAAVIDPLRVTLLVYLAGFAISLGLLLRQSVCQLYGQQWLVIGLIVVFAAIFIIPFSIVIGWFMRQSDWVTVRETVTYWAIGSVNLVWVALGIKLLAFIATVVAARRDRPDLRRGLPATVAGWLGVVSVLAVVTRLLWPSEFWPIGPFHIGWALALAALVVPLSTIIAAPLAVDANRHRGN